MVATIAVSVVLLAWTVAADGRPGFWTWFVLIALANTSLTLLTPTGMSLALEPMGALAGTASGVVGLVSMAGSSLLATWVNSLIVDTVTPLVWAYLGFGGLALVCVLAAGPQAVSDT